MVARAAFGGDPLVVQIGFTRFALRRADDGELVHPFVGEPLDELGAIPARGA